MENEIRRIITMVREKDSEVSDWCENRLYIEIAKIINDVKLGQDVSCVISEGGQDE